MLKNQEKKDISNLKHVKNLLILFISLFLLQFVYFLKLKNSKYSFFIEFNHANGITLGTPIRMRGIDIGYIQNIKLKIDCVLVIAQINSNKIIISRDSIIETTQTGLLNESVIDIIPVKKMDKYLNHSPLSSFCDNSTIVCNNTYMVGDRGLNYDDLVRSTTRISQRFDDPRFFYFFYLFLQNSIELTDSLLVILKNFSNVFDLYNTNTSKFFFDDLI